MAFRHLWLHGWILSQGEKCRHADPGTCNAPCVQATHDSSNKRCGSVWSEKPARAMHPLLKLLLVLGLPASFTSQGTCFILYKESKWIVQVTKLLLSIDSALIHSYLKFWCHGLSLKMSYGHWLLLICLLSTLLAFCSSSWRMHSSLQNLLFIFSCACFKAESIISCATWNNRNRAFLVMKTVTVIKWRLMERLFLWISRVPVFSMLIYSETRLQYCHPNSGIFCPQYLSPMYRYYTGLSTPLWQLLVVAASWTPVPAHDASPLTNPSWIICPLKHMFYSSRTYGLPWSALHTIWSSQDSFLDIFCLIRVIIVLTFCQNGVQKFMVFSFWVCCILYNYLWIGGVPAS